ncbi:sodium-coupled monocarboxylate transporter 1-like [Bacillus rossius redtenbacheri]|uniref:sodium-coupled monocarboxylate transporter 1-like n=1 Tax=Bacillus rossius redtenbacheri TaxID=93214 RepID=UPI002FDE0D66
MEANGSLQDTGSRYEAIMFDWVDHTLFALMLLVSTVVGILIGVCGKQDTKIDYLLGGKMMNTIPVAVSLVASHLSGITLMGVPSEIYVYGAQYSTALLSAVFMCVIINYIYLPVFFSLQLTSTFEYLELRFNQRVRAIASMVFTISTVLHLPIVVYVPALAFSQVSGVNIHLITPIVSIICILYTMMGGLKAVVWTDFLQAFVTVGSCFAVIILGIMNVGGLGAVFERSNEGGRTEIFNLDPSPFARNTFWTVTIGMTFLWLSQCGINQGMVQKFIALPSITNARRSLIIFCIGYMSMKAISCFIGLLIYASYYNCDPIQTKSIERKDQLLPYFIMHTTYHLPGLPGLFIAGIFSAALSTMSSHLNSLAGSLFEDFVLPCIKGTRLSNHATLILRIIVVLVGAVTVLMVFVVEKLGSVLELSYSVGGVTSGTLLGVFSLGILVPWSNIKGAIAGSISSIVVMSTILIGAQKAIAAGKRHAELSTSVEGCDFNVTHILGNTTAVPSSEQLEGDNLFFLFRISYMYYTLVGTFIVMFVGVAVSWATGWDQPGLKDRRLYAPCLHRYTHRTRRGEGINPTEEVHLNTRSSNE